jgi:hypothetical protein
MNYNVISSFCRSWSLLRLLLEPLTLEVQWRKTWTLCEFLKLKNSSSISWIAVCRNTYNRSKYSCKHTEYLAAYLFCMLVQPVLVIEGIFIQSLSTLIASCSFNFGGNANANPYFCSFTHTPQSTSQSCVLFIMEINLSFVMNGWVTACSSERVCFFCFLLHKEGYHIFVLCITFPPKKMVFVHLKSHY